MKNTASHSQGDNEFKIINKFLSLCFKHSGQYSSGTNELKKFQIFLTLVIKFCISCSPQDGTTARFSQDGRNNVCKVLLDSL